MPKPHNDLQIFCVTIFLTSKRRNRYHKCCPKIVSKTPFEDLFWDSNYFLVHENKCKQVWQMPTSKSPSWRGGSFCYENSKILKIFQVEYLSNTMFWKTLVIAVKILIKSTKTYATKRHKFPLGWVTAAILKMASLPISALEIHHVTRSFLSSLFKIHGPTTVLRGCLHDTRIILALASSQQANQLLCNV